MARRALDDAASVGYPDRLPIFFCADGWLALDGIPVAAAMSYLDGAASVVGKSRTGAYGFRDFIQAAKAGGYAEWLWLCGSAPEDGELAQGWPHLYQWNGGPHLPRRPGGRPELGLSRCARGVAGERGGPAQYQVQPGAARPVRGGRAGRPGTPARPAASGSRQTAQRQTALPQPALP